MRFKPRLAANHSLELMLIIIVIGLAAVFHTLPAYKLVTLNLFYLPVVLCGFFLGTYRAGVLAVFCVTAVSIVAVTDLGGLSELPSPLILGLVVTVWGAVLGLISLLVGTLSDERLATMAELHEAYMGVVEVLSRYLQSANPLLKARSSRVAELSQRVAAAMRLSPKEVDDVRVAALLYDIGNVEVTARVFHKAVGVLETNTLKLQHQHTFRGVDLIESLSSVLKGATPLLIRRQDEGDSCPAPANNPLGTRIIWVVRAYDDLTEGQKAASSLSPSQALADIRSDHAAGYDAAVVAALERVVLPAAARAMEDFDHSLLSEAVGSA